MNVVTGILPASGVMLVKILQTTSGLICTLPANSQSQLLLKALFEPSNLYSPHLPNPTPQRSTIRRIGN